MEVIHKCESKMSFHKQCSSSFYWSCCPLKKSSCFTVNDPPPLSLSLPLVDEFGAEGFSGLGLSHGGSFRGGPPSQASEDQDHSSVPGPAPGIGFASGPGSAPSGPPTTNYNNIHIPPGAHAPANTPAELPPPTGTTEVGCVYKQRGHMSTRWSLGLVYSKLSVRAELSMFDTCVLVEQNISLPIVHQPQLHADSSAVFRKSHSGFMSLSHGSI